jgi:hypothetical protein
MEASPPAMIALTHPALPPQEGRVAATLTVMLGRMILMHSPTIRPNGRMKTAMDLATKQTEISPMTALLYQELQVETPLAAPTMILMDSATKAMHTLPTQANGPTATGMGMETIHLESVVTIAHLLTATAQKVC